MLLLWGLASSCYHSRLETHRWVRCAIPLIDLHSQEIDDNGFSVDSSLTFLINSLTVATLQCSLIQQSRIWMLTSPLYQCDIVIALFPQIKLNELLELTREFGRSFIHCGITFESFIRTFRLMYCPKYCLCMWPRLQRLLTR